MFALARVMTWIVPPVAPPPYKTDPDPRKISMRSMLARGIALRRVLASSFSLRRRPSNKIRVFWSPVTPKPRRSI